MKIIVAGVGKVGRSLVENLAKADHEITVIDPSHEVVKKTVDSLTCVGIVGNVCVQSDLIEAGIENADILITCTNDDETNMLACLMAHKYSKCKTIARIRDPKYYDQISYLREELNISMSINPEKVCANEIVRLMRYNSTISSESFLRGRVYLQKISIDELSPLCDMQLKNVASKLDANMLICIIERGEEIIIPNGFDVIKAGDKISFLTEDKDVIKLFKKLGLDYKSSKSIMIVGYGMIAYYLIDKIQEINPGCLIKVIEEDKEKCDKICEDFPKVSVIKGSGTDKDLLLSEGIDDIDAFISLTGIDEENMILSLNAKKHVKGKVIAKVNSLELLDDLKDIDMGSIVNPEVTAANVIDLAVRGMANKRGSNIESLYKICGGKVEALEYIVKNEPRLLNKKLKDMKIKKGILIACIYRNGKVIIPYGNDEFNYNDRVVIISKEHIIEEMVDILEDEH